MFNIIKEHIGFKKQIFSLAKADIIKTYKGSALGWLWAVVKPVTTIFIYWFVFSVGFRSGGSINGHTFFIWLVVGIVPWFYMSEMITQGTDSIRRYSYLVTKMKFPVSTVATFVALSKLLIHFCLLSATFIILLLQGYSFDIYYLQFFYYIPSMFLFFTFWSLFSGPLAAISQDYSNLIKTMMTFIFWFSGIMYDPAKIEHPVISKLLMLNPVTYFAQGYRDTILFKKWFWEDFSSMLSFWGITLVMAVLAVWAYHKLRKDIPDVL